MRESERKKESSGLQSFKGARRLFRRWILELHVRVSKGFDISVASASYSGRFDLRDLWLGRVRVYEGADLEESDRIVATKLQLLPAVSIGRL